MGQYWNQDRSEVVAIQSGCDVGLRPMTWGRDRLYPVIAYLADARIHVQFQRGDSHTPKSDENAPRIGYRYAVRGREGIRITGLLVPSQMRGKGLGANMLRWLVEGAKEDGCPVVGTGRINKPMTALLLQREGFVPQSQDSVAEILEAEPQQVPVIRWLHNVRGARSTIQGSDHYGSFYDVEGPAAVRGYEEPLNSDNVVVLHTTFNR